MKPETLEMLKKLARKPVRRYDPDFCANDHSGGNFDDAWDGGMIDGNRELAQEILTSEGIPLE